MDTTTFLAISCCIVLTFLAVMTIIGAFLYPVSFEDDDEGAR
jgi:hypothetical protein